MSDTEQNLVRIVQDFLEGHRMMRRLFAQHRVGKLRFEELEALVSNDEESVLFRLKERCHDSFRSRDEMQASLADRGALFDLAVGSLFHEAMSFRENFYQCEVYGPRVRKLRDRADPDTRTLFEEFEKILATAGRRLVEGRSEAESLLDQTARELRMLLCVHAENGRVTRYLLEHQGDAEQVFGLSVDALLTEIHGSPAVGRLRAAHSYLEGGHYARAASCFEQAADSGGAVVALAAFSRGMDRYLERDSASCLSELSSWQANDPEPQPPHERLAQAAVEVCKQLAESAGAETLVSQADALLARLQPSSTG
ncbi:MAG: hypothetical protein HRU02_04585 [Myxococcales bacterium]|nr:hypothetical protein [Myxococcales bacterium]